MSNDESTDPNVLPPVPPGAGVPDISRPNWAEESRKHRQKQSETNELYRDAYLMAVEQGRATVQMRLDIERRLYRGLIALVAVVCLVVGAVGWQLISHHLLHR